MQSHPNDASDVLIVLLNQNDPKIQEAIGAAREKISYFITQLRAASNGDTGCAFLVYLEENGKGADVWVAADQNCIVPGKLCGTVTEVPPEWRIIRTGQPILQDPKMVLDWRIIRNQHIEGAFTTKVLLSSMTAEEKTELEQKLKGKF